MLNDHLPYSNQCDSHSCTKRLTYFPKHQHRQENLDIWEEVGELSGNEEKYTLKSVNKNVKSGDPFYGDSAGC